MKNNRLGVVLCLVLLLGVNSLTPKVYAGDIPPALVNAKAQFYNFLRTFVQGEGGMAAQQNIVLNSTILPLDLATDTPFYNHELFRAYADRTFSGGLEGIQASSAAFFSERFSSQYRALMNIVTAQIDQNHPEIEHSLEDLRARQDRATQALTDKINSLDAAWSLIAANRGLQADSVDYEMQHATWAGQVRYSDQIQTYVDSLDRINAQMDATRRRVYKPSEIAALDNYGFLSTAYNIARPWTANVERSFRASGTPLNEFILADPRKLVPAMFDSSPLVFPIGDLVSFLTEVGVRGFDTIHQESSLSASSSSWLAGGSVSFLGWSVGGGGSGSSSMTRSSTKLRSIDIHFDNLSEYLADRSAWFNPGVLQDPEIYNVIKVRPEVNKLQYIAVSLIIARGTKLTLKFSEAVNNSDWSQSAFNANAGVSFLGFSFGGSGGNSRSSYSVNTSADRTTVTIQDGPQVARVLGVRVEPFLHGMGAAPPHALNVRIEELPQLRDEIKALQTGKTSYMQFQKSRIAAQKSLSPER